MGDRKFLIVEARFYEDVADALFEGASAALDAAGEEYDRIEVPGAFEIPGVIHMAHHTMKVSYAGFIALGCVIRGETSHYDYICGESARALMDLSLQGVPLGNGILTVENKDQAMERARTDRKNKGADAANAALRMAEIKAKF